jgi:phosphatidate cytidylyltransferase
MSDDIWGHRRDEEDNAGSGDDPGVLAEVGEAPLSLGDDTGSLPHWTEPPTGQIPRLGGDEPTGEHRVARGRDRRPTGEVPTTEFDVWSTFSDSEGPTWADELDPSGPVEVHEPPPRERTGEHFFDLPDEIPTGRRSARISIGTDPTGDPARPRPTRLEPGRRSGARGASRPGATGRNMPVAVTAGLVIAAVFLGALLWRPAAVVAIVVLVVGLAAVEFYAKVTEKGYRPATFAGLLACVSLPLVAYWVGDGALPLVVVFAFLAAAAGFVGADGIHSGPLPNMAVTMLGVIWIGLMGAYGALLAGLSALGGGFADVGTDTLFLIAIGVVANDVGALFVGSGIGKTPLREWISPNKSVEGLIGGTVFTFLAVILVGIQSDTWNDLPEWLLLALVISVMAPLGDLTESMFKRNLDVKDFGTIVPGHGGALDRFDGFLFVLPAVYYLTLVLEPWASV